MKILVTGAAGFIGFNLVRSLLKRECTVVGVDNLNDYYDVNLKYNRLKELGIGKKDLRKNIGVRSASNSNFEFVELDISDKSHLLGLFESNEFDVVCNFAAQPGVRYSITHPSKYVESNIVGFSNILECCRMSGTKHLVYASSSSVYGLNTTVPFSVKDNVGYPTSLYAATKRANELMAHTYSHNFGIPTTGLRLFTVYGPWGRPDMAYYLFTKLILSDIPIKVFGNGDLLRDYTYIDDVIECVMRVIDKAPGPKVRIGTLSKAPFRIYNIGAGSPVRLLDFVHLLELTLNKKATKIMLPMPLGDVPKTCAGMGEFVEEFGLMPSTPLKEGLLRFVEWYKLNCPAKAERGC